jgi:hypothetical protein
MPCAARSRYFSHKSDIIDATSRDFDGRAVEEILALELFPVLTLQLSTLASRRADRGG